MLLSDYLRARNESEAAFARRADLAQTTVSRAARGEAVPQGRNAQKIIQASKSEPAPGGGTVTLEDLVAAASAEPAA